MITDVCKGTVRVLLKADCPVIADGVKVEVIDILNFPATNSQFVILQDYENIPLNKHGQPDPIISTIRLRDNTFIPEWVPQG